MESGPDLGLSTSTSNGGRASEARVACQPLRAALASPSQARGSLYIGKWGGSDEAAVPLGKVNILIEDYLHDANAHGRGDSPILYVIDF